MSKKKHQIARSMPRQLEVKLNEATALMQRKRWVEAREILEDLAERYPKQVEPLSALVNVNYELKDTRRYQEACERLLQLMPDEPDLTLGLAGAYMENARPVLALRTFHRFLEHFPQHERADEVRKTVTELDQQVPVWLASGGTSGETGLEIAALHEEAQSLLEQGKYSRARNVEEQVLQLKPDFVAALNNISLTYFADGQIDQAIATSQRVLAFDPDNYHALSNLTRYFCLKGRVVEAREHAGRLKAVESDKIDLWVKKAEAYAYLGDDQSVVDTFEGAEREGGLKAPLADPLLYHLAAVAEMRLGRKAQARQHWRQALKLQPGFDLARDNLEDLDKPVQERNAPWPFGVGNWINQRAIKDLLAQLKPVERKSDKALTQAARRYLQQHPEFIALVPLLLDRGDPEGRGFALRLAKMAGTPEMLAALRDFALGQRGPDSMRLEAAQIASRAGLITSGSVRMWTHGDWNDTILLDMEIHDEPTVKHSRQVEEMQDDATVALRQGRPEEAEALLRQALGIEPDAPDLLNNLAVFYEQTGRTLEAEALIRQVTASHPDYAFARISLARMLLLRRQTSEAEELLKPLLARKRFNIGEFGAFCAAQIELFLAKGMPDGARSWLEMWAAVDEDNPQIASYRGRLRFAGGLKGLFGRRP
jgi:tetratricopeptide (TPR) repeat protein